MVTNEQQAQEVVIRHIGRHIIIHVQDAKSWQHDQLCFAYVSIRVHNSFCTVIILFYGGELANGGGAIIELAVVIEELC